MRVGDYVNYDGNTYVVSDVTSEGAEVTLTPIRVQAGKPARTIVTPVEYEKIVLLEGGTPLTGIDIEDVDKVSIGTAKAQGVAKGSVRVFFRNADGTDIEPYQDVKSGKKVVKPADPLLPHHTFEGWFLDDAFGESVNLGTKTFNADTVLYAKFVLDTFDLTFDTKGGSTISPQTKSYGATFDVPTAPTKANNVFVGWFLDDGTFEEEYDFDTLVTGNLTVYAKWAEAWTVTFDVDGGSDIDPILVIKGEICPKPNDPTKEGFDFEGWFEEDTFDTEYLFDAPVTASITLYAKWEAEVGGGEE